MTRLLSFTLAVLACLGCAAPARANTYQFAIPTTLIQSALTDAILDISKNPTLFAFHDICLRPANASDQANIVAPPPLTVANNQDGRIISYSITGFWSPIPTNINGDIYTATGPTIALDDGSNLSARYTYAAGDTLEALITGNANVAGQKYEGASGPVAEVMPGSNTFYLTFDTPATLTPLTPVRFEVYGVAYHFTDAGATAVNDKAYGVTGYFDAAVPEPGPTFLVGAGLGLLAIVGARRRRTGAISS